MKKHKKNRYTFKKIKYALSRVKATFLHACKVITSSLKSITKTFFCLARKLLCALYCLPTHFWIYFLLILFLVGRLLANTEEFRYSFVHQINLSVISFICFKMLKRFHQLLNKIYQDNVGINPCISNAAQRATQWQLSPINFIIPILPVYYFICSIYRMQYIPQTNIGLYAAFMASLAYYISLICYFQLLIAIVTIYKLTLIDSELFPFSYPRDVLETPSWICMIAETYQKGQYAFFTVGLLFTTEYILLIPSDIKILDSNGKINFALSWDFWCTWIVIMVFIVIAFPVIWLCFRNLLTKLCAKLDDKAKSEIAHIATKQKNPDILTVWSQYQLLTSAIVYKKRVFTSRSVYPALTTGLSFFLNIIKLLDVLGIPFEW